MIQALRQLVGKERERHIGPHVVEPTFERRSWYHNGRYRGKKTIYKCKYCGLSGIHPEVSEVNLTWKEDCNDVEWTEADTHELKLISGG